MPVSFRSVPCACAMLLAALAGLTALPAAPGAAAGVCPAAPADEATREALFDALAAAPAEAEGRAAEDEIWRFWHNAPDARAQALLDRIHDRRRWYDFEAAEEAARALTAYCPDYAEGWNQLATVLWLRERPDASLDAVARVLALEPRHFGALSGMALILMRQGRTGPAQAALRAAVAIHPWLKERGLLAPEPGTDL